MLLDGRVLRTGCAPIPAVPTRSQQQFPRVWVRGGGSEVGPGLPSESPRKAAGPQQGWLQIRPCSLGGTPAGLGLAGEGAREGTRPGRGLGRGPNPGDSGKPCL